MEVEGRKLAGRRRMSVSSYSWRIGGLGVGESLDFDLVLWLCLWEERLESLDEEEEEGEEGVVVVVGLEGGGQRRRLTRR